VLSALPAAATREAAAGDRGGAGARPVAADGNDFATMLGRAAGQAEAGNGGSSGPAASQEGTMPEGRPMASPGQAVATGEAAAPPVPDMAAQALPRIPAMPGGAPAIAASVSAQGFRKPGPGLTEGAPETASVASLAISSGDDATGGARPGQDDAARPVTAKGAGRPAPSGESDATTAEDPGPTSGGISDERESFVAGTTAETARAPEEAAPAGVPDTATATPAPLAGMTAAPAATAFPAPPPAGSVATESGAAPSQSAGQPMGQPMGRTIGRTTGAASRAAGAMDPTQAGRTAASPGRALAERRESDGRDAMIRDAPMHPADAPAEAGGDKVPASPSGAAQGTFPGAPASPAAIDIATNTGSAMPAAPSATDASGPASTASPSPASPQPAGQSQGQASAARPLPPPPAGQIAPVVVGLGLGAEAEGRVEVVLEPAELGRVEIRLERDGGKASLHVQAERPETLALLQRDGAELNRALSQAGLAPEGGLSMSFSLSSGGDSGGGTRREGSSAPASPAFAATAAGNGIPTTARLAARGLLDIAI